MNATKGVREGNRVLQKSSTLIGVISHKTLKDRNVYVGMDIALLEIEIRSIYQ